MRLETNSDGPRNHTPSLKRTPGGSMRLLKLPGDPPGTPRGSLGTPWGTPRFPPDVMADILVPQKRPYPDNYPAPEALDCCIRICLLQYIVSRTSRDRFIYKKAAKTKTGTPLREAPGPGVPYIYIYIYMYIYIYIYILA